MSLNYLDYPVLYVDDELANLSTVSYDDHSLLISQTQDAVGNLTVAQSNYRVLGAWLPVDHNLNRNDLEEAVRTASAIGDDMLARSAGRAVVPDSFTHGSARQRVHWLVEGFQEGTIASCNTFAQ